MHGLTPACCDEGRGQYKSPWDHDSGVWYSTILNRRMAVKPRATIAISRHSEQCDVVICSSLSIMFPLSRRQRRRYTTSLQFRLSFASIAYYNQCSAGWRVGRLAHWPHGTPPKPEPDPEPQPPKPSGPRIPKRFGFMVKGLKSETLHRITTYLSSILGDLKGII